MTGPDLSTTAQGFAQGLVSGNNRASTPNSGGDASVILAGTAGPVPSQGSTVVIQDQTQPPPPSQTESSSSSQTRPPSGQAASSGPGAPAPPNAPVQPPASSQAQNPPGIQAGSTPTSQVSSSSGSQVGNFFSRCLLPPVTKRNQQGMPTFTHPPVPRHHRPPVGRFLLWVQGLPKPSSQEGGVLQLGHSRREGGAH